MTDCVSDSISNLNQDRGMRKDQDVTTLKHNVDVKSNLTSNHNYSLIKTCNSSLDNR